MEGNRFINIDLSYIEPELDLTIDARQEASLFIVSDALEHNEAIYQIVEGCFYDYEFSNTAYSFETSNVVSPHLRKKHLGTIAPNIYVGTISLPIIYENAVVGDLKLEVQSIKAGYRDDYRDMLEFIAAKSADLMMLVDSPVSQLFETDFIKSCNKDSLYQKFAFIKSIIDTDEFSEAVYRIVTAPVTRWTETQKSIDIRNARRFTSKNIIEITTSKKRIELPDSHHFTSYYFKSLPARIESIHKKDSVDTSENRFIKHALESFLRFCIEINNRAKVFLHKGLENESGLLIQKLENYLNHSIFKQISRPDSLKLNSPVLQRKEGYREILRVWLMFDLAAKLVWSGGDDIYHGGKKDIATLYEYWLFFQLLDLFQTMFDIKLKDLSELIEPTADGLNLQIKQGKFTALQGVFNAGSRILNFQFNYNRSFKGRSSYPDPGSWTTTLRPDYTLTFWPYGISELEAEKQEIIVHIHFDAKYKIANLKEFLKQATEKDLNNEKIENRKGIYKNADLLKMHAYKDAIRRTSGAYILYPGDKSINQKGFHEIIPGLGAFAVQPSKSENGIKEIKAFIQEVINHFINRTTQREKYAFSTFDIFKDPPEIDNEIRELLPEPYNQNRSLVPDNTYILVGFYHSEMQLEWIKRTRLYNFRTGTGPGSLILDKETVNAKFLLLHTTGDKFSSDLWRIVSKGPRVFSKEDLINKKYPSPTQNHYLVIQIEPVTDPEFKNVKWDFRKLKNYSTGRSSAFPFTANLTELMKHKVKSLYEV